MTIRITSRSAAWAILVAAFLSFCGIALQSAYIAPKQEVLRPKKVVATTPPRAKAEPAKKSTPAVVDAAKEFDCLWKNIYWEGHTQGRNGQRMIGYVTVKRKGEPSWPNTICGVVFQKRGKTAQFSWTMQVSAKRVPLHRAKSLIAREVAREVLAGWQPVNRKFRCARFYKRDDDKGVSRKNAHWFDRALVKVGVIEDHAYYCASR